MYTSNNLIPYFLSRAQVWCMVALLLVVGINMACCLYHDPLKTYKNLNLKLVCCGRAVLPFCIALILLIL